MNGAKFEYRYVKKPVPHAFSLSLRYPNIVIQIQPSINHSGGGGSPIVGSKDFQVIKIKRSGLQSVLHLLCTDEYFLFFFLLHIEFDFIVKEK